MPIVLLENLSPSQGLRIGTRLRIDILQDWIINATILNGTHIGEPLVIPRINL